jgi:hypothetical protein
VYGTSDELVPIVTSLELLQTLAVSDVSSDDGGSDDAARFIMDRRNRYRHLDDVARLCAPLGFVMVDMLTRQDPEEYVGLLTLTSVRNDEADVLPDRFLRAVPVQALSARVPGIDDRLVVLGIDGIVGPLDQRTEAIF